MLHICPILDNALSFNINVRISGLYAGKIVRSLYYSIRVKQMFIISALIHLVLLYVVKVAVQCHIYHIIDTSCMTTFR